MRRTLPLFVVLLLAACERPTPDGGSARDRVLDTTAAIEGDMAADSAALWIADSTLQAAAAARDLERIMSMYADDAVYLPISAPTATGRVAIRELWTRFLAIPGFENRSRLASLEVSRAGDIGYTRGTFETSMLDPGGAAVVERGAWVTVWKRGADGAWRVAIDIAKSDAPPPEHQDGPGNE